MFQTKLRAVTFYISKPSRNLFHPRSHPTRKVFLHHWKQLLISRATHTPSSQFSPEESLNLVPQIGPRVDRGSNNAASHEHGFLKKYEQGLSLGSLDPSSLDLIFERFRLKDLDAASLQKYDVRTSRDRHSLMFPYESLGRDLVGIQFLHCKNGQLSKNFCSNSFEASLFGWLRRDRNSREIIVTSDPLDAIAIHQTTDLLAVALPHDTLTFPQQLLDMLKEFERVVLWLKAHQHDWKTHRSAATCLGKTAFFVRPSEDSSGALSCLQGKQSIRHVLRNAYRLSDEDVQTYDSYRDALYREFKDHRQSAGLKWKRFGVLNELLKGHRPGELTVFSGQTGTGKTTFISEYSLDLCMQGLPTLWGSFEITNTRLTKTMLTQFSRCSFSENLQGFEYWSEEFLKIPMFFLNFHGQRSIKRVLKAMVHCVIVYRIQHIVIDNLQFMMNMEDCNSTFDHLRRQDQFFAAFREFATQHHCHITLVMHPRKEPEFTELHNASISGTAKAMQEADNILLLQTTKSRQYLQVTKNRFDGQKGCVLVEFDKKTQTFTVRKQSAKSQETDSFR